MSDPDQPGNGFDVGKYVRSQTGLRQLKSTLPEHSVEQLAREVLRRLASHSGETVSFAPPKDEIEHLCNALLSENDNAAAEFIQDLRSEGVSIETAYLVYLAGAARLLGEWWESDKVSFTAVTLGTSRMYGIMRALRHQFGAARAAVKRSAVFVSVPGETHVLGVRMAADLFRKEGWEIDLIIDKPHDELVDEVSQSRAIIIGISAGGEHAVEALSKLMIALRISNPNAWIFVSGNIVDEARDAIELMDPDGMVTTIEDAKKILNGIWDGSEPT